MTADPSPGPGDLYEVCRELLDACDRALVTSPGGKIERRYVSPGTPLLDVCEQLTVHCVTPSDADTSPLTPSLAPAVRSKVQGAVHLVSLAITVVRCVPTFSDEQGSAPEPSEYDDAASVTLGDMWAIWHSVREEYRRGTLFAGRPFVYFDPAVPLPIAGGAGGWMIPVRINLDGYPLA